MMTKFLSKSSKILENLLGLIQLFSGLPARASELNTIILRNFERFRSLYYDKGNKFFFFFDPIMISEIETTSPILFFDKRLTTWMKTIGVALGITDYYIRYEFQQRGAIHAHLVLWIANQPNIKDLDLDNQEDRLKILKFIEHEIQISVDHFPEIPLADHPSSRTKEQILNE